MDAIAWTFECREVTYVYWGERWGGRGLPDWPGERGVPQKGRSAGRQGDNFLSLTGLYTHPLTSSMLFLSFWMDGLLLLYMDVGRVVLYGCLVTMRDHSWDDWMAGGSNFDRLPIVSLWTD